MTDDQTNNGKGKLPITNELESASILKSDRTADCSTHELNNPKLIENDSSEHCSRFADNLHQYLSDYIKFADQKAVFFFGICSAFIAYINTKQVTDGWHKPFNNWIATDWLSFLACIGLSISIIFFLWVVIPNLKGSKRGIVFFNAIAEFGNNSEFANSILSESEKSLAIAKLQHCYDLAIICKKKFFKLGIGLWLGAIGVLLSLTFLFLA